MSKYSVVRNGTPFTGPVVVTKVDDSRLAAGGGGTGLTVMVVGESTGGFPAGYTLPNGTVVPPMIFGSSGEATSKLRSGELLWMVQRAFAGGAPKVAAVRVNQAQAATVNLLDGSAAISIAVTAADPGIRSNLVKYQVAAGTDQSTYPAGRRVTITDTSALPELVIAQDNLYFLGFALQYTGSGTAATMTVSATALTTAITGAAADNLNLLFSQYPNLAQLISAINGTGKYAVTLASTDGRYRSSNLDILPATNILPAPVSVTGITNAVIEFLNLAVSGQVVATRGIGTIPAFVSGYLAGGTEYGAGGTITTAHWQTALDQSRTIDAQLCCAATASPTIQALCKTNGDFMNDGRQGKMERMWYLGCANGETLATALTNASALNSPACLYVYPGGKDFDPTGLIRRSNGDPEVVNIPGYYLAATLAGVKASGGVEEPLSRASVTNCLGLQTDLTYTQLTDQVEDGGICALIKGQASFVPGGSNAGVTVWHGITTYVGSANFARHIESIQLVNQYVARTIRDAVSDYLAASPRKVASVTTKASLKALVEARFRNLERQGIIVGSADKEAFTVEDNGITFEGTAITVKACYYPAKPIEQVFIDLQNLDLSF